MDKFAQSVFIGCEVIRPEVEALVASEGLVVSLEFLPLYLHERPELLRAKLQERIDELSEKGTAKTILLGFGLCGNGLIGIGSSRSRIVVPRAHDCLTLHLGSHKRYLELHEKQPDVYWYTPGWNRGGRAPGPERFSWLKEQLQAQGAHDEEEIEELLELERESLSTYSGGHYVALPQSSCCHEEKARSCCAYMGWGMQTSAGDDGLIRSLLQGPWDDERFLVLAPGQRIAFAGREEVIRAEKGNTCQP